MSMTAFVTIVASIPAPPGSDIELGPLTLRAYGVMIALGVLAAVEIARRRWKARGGHDDDIIDIAYRAVPAGLIGARIYHVITDWKAYFPDNPIDVFKIWNGGLGIPGGLVLGIWVGVRYARKQGWDIPDLADAIIPGIPIAQAIGRLGNWWNQEIFGKPTTLPWALEVDERFRPGEFKAFETFHPAFLYEALWNVALAIFLIWLDSTKKLKKGQILPVWVAGYGVGRFVLESIRDDFASLILGVRVNHWVSAIAVIGGAFFYWRIGKAEAETSG
jgi:prolipoprotein diacylglyceryl transferase